MSKIITVFIFLTIAGQVMALYGQNNGKGQEVGSDKFLVDWRWDFTGSVNISQLDSLRMLPLPAGQSPGNEDIIFQAFSAQVDRLHFNFKEPAFTHKYIADAVLLQNSRFYRPETSVLFEAMGDYMLSKLGDTLKTALNTKQVDDEDDEILYLVRRLADEHVFIDVKISNAAKTWRYLKEGRFGYVFHKLTTTYRAEFFKFLVIVILIGLIILYLRKRVIKYFNKNKHG